MLRASRLICDRSGWLINTGGTSQSLGGAACAAAVPALDASTARQFSGETGQNDQGLKSSEDQSRSSTTTKFQTAWKIAAGSEKGAGAEAATPSAPSSSSSSTSPASSSATEPTLARLGRAINLLTGECAAAVLLCRTFAAVHRQLSS